MSSNFLGEDYPYYKYIKSPGDLGMSSKGTMDALSKDVSGLIDYVQILVSGSGKASATGKPLGNKYFLDTKATCVDSNTNEEKSRYIYIDNVPEGNIPIISGGTGINFSEFRGLLPGTLSNLNVLNPSALMNAFTTGSKPKCQQITMQTIDNNNKKSMGTYYVALADIATYDPCSFPDGKNPVTKAKCKQGFQPNMSKDNHAASVSEPENPVVKFYFASVATLGVYILYKLMRKS
jgi:hypothetical protein